MTSKNNVNIKYAKMRKIILQTQDEKIKLLADSLNVPKDSNGDPVWRKLAYALANEYVQGFKLIGDKKSRKHSKWNSYTRARLYLEVKTIAQKQLFKGKNYSEFGACAILTSKVPWKGRLLKNTKKSKRLYDEYLKARESPLVLLFKNSIRNMSRDDFNYIDNGSVQLLLGSLIKIDHILNSSIDQKIV